MKRHLRDSIHLRTPERSTLDKRLSGWIEKDFKKTQIGKSAFKQGAGKRQR